MKSKKQNLIEPVVLIIMDGWGISNKRKDNPIWMANTPNIDSYYRNYPWTTLYAHGTRVGIPDQKNGHSEAGHLNIGAGRVVEQDSMRINRDIRNQTFYRNPAFLEVIKNVKKRKSSMHLMGLLAQKHSGHAQLNHLIALIKLCKQQKIWGRTFLHLFTDGRDAPPRSALKILNDLEKKIKGDAHVATIIGRFYAMDRNKKWNRTKLAYEAMVMGIGMASKSPYDAITCAYNRDESDEFIPPTVICQANKPKAIIKEKDSIIFFNLRSDRARQLTKAFVQQNFHDDNPKAFSRRKRVIKTKFCALTDFGPDLSKDMYIAYPEPDLPNTLPIMLKNYKQLYIAESEKYAHITYFFNGGYNNPVNGETWMKIPSPDVTRYDQKPEMSAFEITNKVLAYLKKKKYNLIVINFANPDMVAHSGNIKATIKAVEVVDKCVGKIVNLVKKHHGVAFVTADHGNAEELVTETAEIDTKHSNNKVPFIIISDLKLQLKSNNYKLANIAPTILDVLHIHKPHEMVQSILKK